MVLIGAKQLSDEVLQEYDQMMVEALPCLKRVAPLAINVWTEVLAELDDRGQVQLVDGSYEDIGNAHIRRLWTA